MEKEYIKDWQGRILGVVETDDKGNKTVRDFYNVILGFYKKDLNITTDFNGRMLTKGDTAVGLIFKK